MNAMSEVKVTLNKAGVRQLLLSDEIMDYCDDIGSGIMQRCGDGYEKTQYHGKNRVNVSIHTATPKAFNDNMKHNTLLKALK